MSSLLFWENFGLYVLLIVISHYASGGGGGNFAKQIRFYGVGRKMLFYRIIFCMAQCKTCFMYSKAFQRREHK